MSFRNQAKRVMLATAVCLSLSACGPRPTEANKRWIVLTLQQQLGAVKSIRFLPVENRCELNFECYIIPYQGTPGLYRGTYGYDAIECDPVTPVAEPSVK